MKKLTANSLKSVLWDTLNEVKDGKMSASDGHSVARQAREILRTVNTELSISKSSIAHIPNKLLEFIEKE